MKKKALIFINNNNIFNILLVFELGDIVPEKSVHW